MDGGATPGINPVKHDFLLLLFFPVTTLAPSLKARSDLRKTHAITQLRNFLTDHVLRVHKNWPMLLRITRSV